MITLEQFNTHINIIKEQYEKQRKISIVLEDLKMFDNTVYFSISDDIIQGYINLLELVMDDPDEPKNGSWLAWFIWENDFGNEAMEVTCGKFKNKKIKTNKHIYDVIIEFNKIKKYNRRSIN